MTNELELRGKYFFKAQSKRWTAFGFYTLIYLNKDKKKEIQRKLILNSLMTEFNLKKIHATHSLAHRN